MSNANKLFFAFALGFSAAVFVSQATAQHAAQQSAAGEAAIHRCINQAHRGHLRQVNPSAVRQPEKWRHED
jgi:hypothetical protein